MSRDLPMLAPLLDKMTTWDLNSRFTASEALQFFEERMAELSDEQLQVIFWDERLRIPYNEYDRWEGLPICFVERWKAYRVAPLPWHMRFLRSLCQRRYFYYIVPKTRMFFYRLLSPPRWFFTWITPSKIFV